MTRSASFRAALGRGAPDDATRSAHLWWCLDDEPAFDRVDWLSESERTHGRRYHFEHLRRAYRVRRSFLRAVLATYADCEPASLRFRSGDRGKPYLEESDGTALLMFNLSHSEGRVLVAVTRMGEIGVDLQAHIALKDDLESMARQVMTEEEHVAYRAAPEDERVRRFYRLWARKEAVLKASGQGLFREPNTFAVGHSLRAPSEAQRAPDGDAWDGVRSLGDIDAPDGFSAALASVAPELPPVWVARPAP